MLGSRRWYFCGISNNGFEDSNKSVLKKMPGFL